MRGFGIGWLLRGMDAKLDTIITQQGVIMSKLEDLQVEVTALTEGVVGIAGDIDIMQTAVGTVVTDLKALLATGATAEQLQTEIDKLQAARSTLATARADLASTLEPVPAPPPPEVPIDPPVEPPTGGGETGVSGGQSFRRR